MFYANTYLDKPVVDDLEQIPSEGSEKILHCMLNTG